VHNEGLLPAVLLPGRANISVAGVPFDAAQDLWAERQVEILGRVSVSVPRRDAAVIALTTNR